ncbi:MAG: UPF0175 family protein [Bacteroidota bacterium]
MQSFVIHADLLAELNLSAEELRVDLAALLYDQERLTLAQAKKLAGVTQIKFQQELSRRNIPLKYDMQELEEDMETLRLLEEDAHRR